jgi:hypothetical protein
VQDSIEGLLGAVQRGVELRQVLELLLSLFRRQPRAPGQFWEVDTVPYLVTNPNIGQGTDWLSGITNLGASAAQIVAALRGGGGAMPGGAFSAAGGGGGMLENILAGRGILNLGGPDFSNVVSGSSSCPTSSPWRAGATRARATRFSVPNPVTGEMTGFKPTGAVLLDASDVAGWRKVRRIGRKFGRRVGGR